MLDWSKDEHYITAESERWEGLEFCVPIEPDGEGYYYLLLHGECLGDDSGICLEGDWRKCRKRTMNIAERYEQEGDRLARRLMLAGVSIAKRLVPDGEWQNETSIDEEK